MIANTLAILYRALAAQISTSSDSRQQLCRERGHDYVLAQLHLPFCDTTHTRSLIQSSSALVCRVLRMSCRASAVRLGSV